MCINFRRSHGQREYLINLSRNKIASCSLDFTIKIWNLTKGNCLESICTLCSDKELYLNLKNKSLFNSQITIKNLQLHNTCLTDSLNLIRKIYDSIRRLLGHTGLITCIIKLNKTLIASGSQDQTLKIYDIEQEMCIKTLYLFSGFIFCI